MCGINGLVLRQADEKIDLQLKLMNDLIIHRGPDDDGIYKSQSRIAMGMRRLSIIDLEHGKQPMTSLDGRFTIVFNGEIYNYRELKAEQESRGHQFRTTSDTEVVLSLYQELQEQCLEKLNGMFTFSIHDSIADTIFIARDRFGEKPLHYYHDDEKFIWASELKSIVKAYPGLKKIDTEALSIYFGLTYIPAPYTIYQDIKKLKAGHFLKLSVGSFEKEIVKYWDINPNTKAGNQISYPEALQSVENLLFESVEKRMIADVPLGVFLSGGVDSTVIAAIMSKISPTKIKTFSVGFTNKKYDESDRAKLVADHVGAEHREYILNYEDLYDEVDALVLNYDEPFADSSCIPTYFIAKKTSQHVKVALTGDGGDEVFGGYNKYMAIRYRQMFNKYIPNALRERFNDHTVLEKLLSGRSNKSFLNKMRKAVSSLNSDLVNSHLDLLSLGFRKNELARLVNQDVYSDHKVLLIDELIPLDSDSDELKQARYIDREISLEGDMLVKVDRASMLCSLECRSPFLDHRLMEFTYKLPDDYLIRRSNKKRILKDAFEKMLPKNFFKAPKSGFEIPVGEWFRGGMKDEIQKMLSVQNLERHGLLNVGYIRELLEDHLSSKADHSWKLWTLFCFQKWYIENFSNA